MTTLFRYSVLVRLEWISRFYSSASDCRRYAEELPNARILQEKELVVEAPFPAKLRLLFPLPPSSLSPLSSQRVVHHHLKHSRYTLTSAFLPPSLSPSLQTIKNNSFSLKTRWTNQDTLQSSAHTLSCIYPLNTTVSLFLFPPLRGMSKSHHAFLLFIHRILKRWHTYTLHVHDLNL